MTQSLTKTPDHLAKHRRLIIGRSMAAAGAGALPIPMVDEWLASSIKRGLIKKIAADYSVDISDEGIARLADGRKAPPAWSRLLSGSFLVRLVAKQWRKFLVAVVAAKRVRAASKNFSRATCFDHYCSRLHVGLGLDLELARDISEAIDAAIRETPSGLSRHLFRSSLSAAAGFVTRAPKSLFSGISPDWLDRLLSRESDVEAAEEVEAVLDHELSAPDSTLSKLVSSVERQFGVVDNDYLRGLITNFDRIWSDKTK